MKFKPSSTFVALLMTGAVMISFCLPEASAAADIKSRDEVPDKYKWNLNDIFPDWRAWETSLTQLEKMMDDYAALKGTLAQGPEQVLKAYRLGDEIGILLYKVFRYPQLMFDLDQRDNEVNARVQRVQILLAKFNTATSWFSPELLTIPHDTMEERLDSNTDLALYRFAIEDLYRKQEHVLNEEGERLLSYATRLNGSIPDAYSSLTTADIQYPAITLSNGEEVVLSYAQYTAIINTSRVRTDRQLAFRKFYQTYNADVNTYAALYNSVLQRDWFQARARNYQTTLDAALFGNNIPASVVENLVSTVRQGTGPLQRYFNLRKKVLGLPGIDLYDGRTPLIDFDKKYDFVEAVKLVTEAVAPLGNDYQKQVKKGLASRWIDVYENPGKRIGGYSASVYGVHPFVLMNYTNTLDEVFTLAHEMGHSMHSMLSQANQPFIYSDYTIFVAEVASTMNEALLLDYMLAHTDDPQERVTLLQNSIDKIVGTFYSQVMFADYELQAHGLVEQGQPITAEVLDGIYYDLLKTYYGDSAQLDSLYRITWARIPHLYRTPYYVYQYATSFAASAKLAQEITAGDKKERKAALERYLTLLKSGGHDYPVEQLKKAGVDLTEALPVQTVINRFNELVTRLEEELSKP